MLYRLWRVFGTYESSDLVSALQKCISVRILTNKESFNCFCVVLVCAILVLKGSVGSCRETFYRPSVFTYVYFIGVNEQPLPPQSVTRRVSVCGFSDTFRVVLKSIWPHQRILV